MLDGLLVLGGASSFICVLANISGVSWYDISEAKLSKCLIKSSKSHKKRPTVTAIVVSGNNQAGTLASLNSLSKSRYRKLQIIVADNSSNDDTKLAVKQFMRNHPNQAIDLYSKKQAVSRSEIIKLANAAKTKGDIVLILSSGMVIEKQTITNVANRFSAQKDTTAIRLNCRVGHSLHLFGLFQEFSSLINGRSLKVYSAFKLSQTYLENNYAQAMTAETLKKVFNKQPVKWVYVSSITLYMPPQPVFTLLSQSMQPNFRAIGGIYDKEYNFLNKLMKLIVLLSMKLTYLLVPIILAYFTYLAVYLQEPRFFLIAWGLLSFFLFFTIIEDEQLRLRQKLNYVFLMPVSHLWFYFTALLQYLRLMMGAIATIDKL